MAAATETTKHVRENRTTEDETLLLFARLMEGGQEDDETVQDLDLLTKLLNDDAAATASKDHVSICKLIDEDCVDTLLGYLDMRQPDVVRGHAALSVSAYLKAAKEDGEDKLSTFFFARVKRGTYDDYIVAFCVAAAIFPIVPDLSTKLFLREGFVSTLGPLMRRKWKSRKVETACLEMLNAACFVTVCREAVQKYCVEWLEEIVDQDPEDYAKNVHRAGSDLSLDFGSVSMRHHSETVRDLAAVILAKLSAVPLQPDPTKASDDESRIRPATTSIEDLSKMFTTMLSTEDQGATKHSIEGLAYASLQPAVKESLAHDSDFLKQLVKALTDAAPKSPNTYGALSILVNLTRYQPAQSEEEKKMGQLKAYANAAPGSITPNPLNDHAHVAKRCQAVFDSDVVPVLVTHSKKGSPASLALIISIIYSLSVAKVLRGPLSQQGAVPLLLQAYSSLPESDATPRRLAAQTLARILISTNPALVFGGTRPIPQSTAIRPLVSILPLDQTAETRDLLPTFESLMALTNLASTDEDTRRSIIRFAWPEIEDLVLASNALVRKAAVELICNLVLSAECVAKYADGTPQASNRLHILLALADSEDEGTRSAAGGALASLTDYEQVVAAMLERDSAVKILLGLCAEDSEDLRHRGVVCVYNVATADGKVGEWGRKRLKDENGVAVLTECVKKSRRAEVVEIGVHALKALVESE